MLFRHVQGDVPRSFCFSPRHPQVREKRQGQEGHQSPSKDVIPAPDIHCSPIETYLFFYSEDLKHAQISKRKNMGAKNSIWELLNTTHPLCHLKWIEERIYASYFETSGGYPCGLCPIFEIVLESSLIVFSIHSY